MTAGGSARARDRERYVRLQDAGHAWAYLPDVAKTIARLVKRQDALEPLATFHSGGHWFERGGEITERVRVAAGAP